MTWFSWGPVLAICTWRKNLGVRGFGWPLSLQIKVWGDGFAPWRVGEFFVGQCLDFHPVDHYDIGPQLGELSQAWPEELRVEQAEVHPVCFGSGKFQEFFGFGDQTPGTMEAIGPFLSCQREWVWNPPPSDWVRRLEASDLGDIFPRQFVTHLEVEKGRITGFTLNGAKNYKTSGVVYGESLRNLGALFPQGGVGTSLLQKLSKTPSWGGVHLFLRHKYPVTEESQLHVLRGSSKDSEPCLGRFALSRDSQGRDQYLSRWVSFLPSEGLPDGEFTGKVFREMKRQIRRAYPKIVESIELERLYIEPLGAAIPGGVLRGGKLPTIENLWVTGPGLHPNISVVGDILWAEHQWLQIMDECENPYGLLPPPSLPKSPGLESPSLETEMPGA